MSTLFPLEAALAHVRSSGQDVRSGPNGLEWQHFDGVTSLVVEEIDHPVPDGRLVSEVVTVRHSSAALDALPRGVSGTLNRWATQSALVESADGRLELVSKVGIFSEDQDAAERIYAPLICMEALTIGWHAACLSRQIFEIDPESSPLHDTNATPPFSPDDFLLAKQLTEVGEHIGSLSDGQLTVEFAWDPGAKSSSFLDPRVRELALQDGNYANADLDTLGGRTSLFQIMTVRRHALYGNGVFCSLEIPLSVSDAEAAALSEQLNLWELSRPHLPPFFGAWCVGPRAPTFVTFLPNQFCFPGLLQNLTAWAQVRHEHLVELFSEPTNFH